MLVTEGERIEAISAAAMSYGAQPNAWLSNPHDAVCREVGGTVRTAGSLTRLMRTAHPAKSGLAHLDTGF